MKRTPVYITVAGYSIGLYALTYVDYFAVALGTTPFLQSILVSVRNLGGTMLQLIWGALSDKRGRKTLLMYGFLVYGVTSISLLAISSPVMLILLVIVQSLLGSTVVPVWNALLGDYSIRRTRGAFIGEVTAFGTVAAVFAILLIGYVSDLVPGELNQYFVPFSVAAFCFFLAAVSSRRITEQMKPVTSTVTLREAVLKDNRFTKFLWINGFYRAVMALAWPLFAFVTVDVVGATKFQMSIIWAIHMFIGALSQKYGGILSDRIGRRKSLFWFHLPFFMVSLLYGIADNWLFLVTASFFGGFGMGAGTVALNSYILDCAHEEKRASYTALNNLVFGITSFLASIASGAAAEHFTGTMGLVPTLHVMLLTISVLRFCSVFLYLKTDETLYPVGAKST
ncbi:MAG: MFS transporter [Theionarchaea archaeon]|nr:MFS transporter [Theionarchaea archaeon]